MSFTTTIFDLEPGDEIKWPNGTGGYIWPRVLRNLECGQGDREILLGGIATQEEMCHAAQGMVPVCVMKNYPGDVEVIIRRPIS